MKVLFDGTMELITPCFCAGADQTKAEIRAPSIRIGESEYRKSGQCADRAGFWRNGRRK